MMSDLQAGGLRHLVDEIQEQFLLCQICRKSYSRPKNLSCLHTFCLKCIETVHENEVSSRKYGDPREVTCPICLKKSQLPIGGPRNLMDNFLVLNLSELVEKQKSSVEETPQLICDICKEENPVLEHKKDSKQEKVQPKPIKRKSFMSAGFSLSILSDKHYEACKRDDNDDNKEDDDDDDDDDEEVTQCNGEVTDEKKDSGSQNHVNGSSQSDPESESQKVAVSKCLECNKLLCASCIKKHQSMKVTSRHSMIDVETEKDVECKEHPGEPVRFFCDPCQMCVCVLCAFNTHREHDVEHFSDAALKHRDPLKSLIKICEEKVTEFKDTFQAISRLEKNLRETEEKIREASSNLVMQIRQQERQLIEKLRADIDPRIFDYIDSKKDLNLQMETLHNTCCLANIVVDSNDVEMLLLKKEVEDKLTTLSLVGLKELPEGALAGEMIFTPGQADLGEVVRVLPEMTQETEER